jgi:Tol biopolymer transport system component
MNADGSDRTQLTDTPVGAGPTWSPDSKQIAFANDRGGNLNIYVMNACCQEAGTNQLQQLTDDPLNDTDPSWSPEGKKIAYASLGVIYVMNSDGSNANGVAALEEPARAPAWQPLP